MTRFLWLVSVVALGGASLGSASLGSASQSQPAGDGSGSAAVAFHAVSYVEVEATAAAKAVALAALRTYQSASRSQDGFLRFEAFEQEGRPGHYTFIETWRDQMVFDARDQTALKQLTDALKPIRISDIDRRPYKTMTVAPPVVSTGDPVFVITHVDASPTPQLPALLERLAEESRRDAGNLRFDIMQHTMRANHFTIIEAWRDHASLDAHAASTHMRQYRDAYGPMAGSPLDERLFTPLRL